jgi:hypothetical protein
VELRVEGYIIRANQTLLLLLKTAFLAEKKQISIVIVFGLIRSGSNPRSTPFNTSTFWILLDIIRSYQYNNYKLASFAIKYTCNPLFSKHKCNFIMMLMLQELFLFWTVTLDCV